MSVVWESLFRRDGGSAFASRFLCHLDGHTVRMIAHSRRSSFRGPSICYSLKPTAGSIADQLGTEIPQIPTDIAVTHVAGDPSGPHFKRARVSSMLFGDANDHCRRIARLSAF